MADDGFRLVVEESGVSKAVRCVREELQGLLRRINRRQDGFQSQDIGKI